jgi:hypothetical protein
VPQRETGACGEGADRHFGLNKRCGDALARRLRCDVTSVRDFGCVWKALGPPMKYVFACQPFAINILSIDVLKSSGQVQRN